MKRVILESPFAGNVERNVAYAKLCMKEMLEFDEAPIASHLLWTLPGLLDDNNPEQRRLGIAAGHAWLAGAEGVVFYVDFGISKGMEIGIERARAAGVAVFIRQLKNQTELSDLIARYPDLKPDSLDQSK